MLNFNELLMTEKFINEIFVGLKCLLKVPEHHDQMELEPADLSEKKDLLHTFEELKSMVDPAEVCTKDVTE